MDLATKKPFAVLMDQLNQASHQWHEAEHVLKKDHLKPCQHANQQPKCIASLTHMPSSFWSVAFDPLDHPQELLGIGVRQHLPRVAEH